MRTWRLLKEFRISPSEFPIQNIQEESALFGLPISPAAWCEGWFYLAASQQQAVLEPQEVETMLQDNLDLMYESEQPLDIESAEIVLPSEGLTFNFPLLIDAALAGTTTSGNRQEAREVLSNAGYQVVDSNDVSSPLTFGASQHVLNRFASGRQTSAEILAQAINAYAAYARIPKQLIMVIPAHWMLADSGATMHLLLDLLLAYADVETNRII